MMRLSSYNCRGLPKDTRSTLLRPDIQQLFNNSDIICLQETWYGDQDLEKLPMLFKNFHSIGVSTTDYSKSIVQGHPSGGVAMF